MGDFEMTIIEVELGDFLKKVMEEKAKNCRLMQAHAVSIPDGYELFYTFGNQLQWESIKLTVKENAEVPSITDIYPCAFLYENEIKELFGANILMIEPDYTNKLYRIEAKTPMKKKTEGGK